MKNVPLGQCHQLLLKYGLGDSANKKVGNYSSGMKQKLAIARASLGDPEIMILDEPTAGLDPRAVILVRDTIKELNKKGVTFFISSHILSEIQAICNRVGIINHGVLVAKNSVNELTKQLQIKPKLFLQLTKITDKIIKEIKSLKGVEKVDKQGEELIVICSPEARAKVILLIEKHGETVLNMRTEEISLEEVFMKFTEG